MPFERAAEGGGAGLSGNDMSEHSETVCPDPRARRSPTGSRSACLGPRRFAHGESASRAWSSHGVRERPLPQQGRVLRTGHGHVPDPGWRVHPGLPLLQRGAGLPGAAGPDEPAHVADAAALMGLRHVVVTSVTRDDLPDGGRAILPPPSGRVRGRLPDATRGGAGAGLPRIARGSRPGARGATPRSSTTTWRRSPGSTRRCGRRRTRPLAAGARLRGGLAAGSGEDGLHGGVG